MRQYTPDSKAAPLPRPNREILMYVVRNVYCVAVINTEYALRFDGFND